MILRENMTHLLQETVLTYFAKYSIPLSAKIVLGISGGLDSMLLLHTVNEVLGSENVLVAHCNYHLRGDESDDDMLFLLGRCDAMGNKIYIHQSRLLTKDQSAIQAEARNIRYTFFEKIANEQDCYAIATAHHLDDQLETLLMRMGRGAGLTGLQGIPEYSFRHKSQIALVRPFLQITKDKLVQAAAEISLPYREDSSNASNVYMRNNIRHTVLPAWKEAMPTLTQSIQHSIRQLQDAENFIQKSKREVLSKSLEFQTSFILKLNKKVLLSADPYIIKEILFDFGLIDSDEAEKFLHSAVGSTYQTSQYKIIHRSQDVVILFLQQDFELKRAYIENQIIWLPEYYSLFYDIETVEKIGIPSSLLVGSLRIDSAQNYLNSKVPTGDHQHKTVLKILKEYKILPEDRPNIPLLIDESNFVWAVLPWRSASIKDTAEAHPENMLYFYTQFF